VSAVSQRLHREVLPASAPGVVTPSGLVRSVAAGGELERVVLGELHLVRRLLDRALVGIATVVRATERVEEWEDVERAARIAARGLDCSIAAVPPQPLERAEPGVLVVGRLRIDPRLGRQWWDGGEFELSPLLRRLLTRLASEPYRFFSREELLREVWGLHTATQATAIAATVMRLRRALEQAGAPRGELLVTRPRVGFALLAGEREGGSTDG
jgi:hypothetical protein